ncbi:hypothetical protein B0H67DRAFT_594226 [Lasiosphaeris hirsuta]|uniref:Uncharacterized protein n=1 Tax=Lasiosphaeris hirsuta TaxID=260670 RepID=A0AA39ZXK8_9PEZI|nr:hypothetical protein B0H67DRAFT_594226 [Lasiosphaeris hirsuta]
MIVFRRPSEFKPLRSLLNENHLKLQWCRRKSSPQYNFWKGWGKGLPSARSDNDSQYKAFFNLYFWRVSRPRNLLCMEQVVALFDLV